MKKKIGMDHITLGVCYYPEHWDRSMWRDDLKKMKAYGIEVIRIAEFAWNFFEPKEGRFTFEFFDAFMDLAVEEGMKVIFCTPTATPPAWMSERYPEILNADLDGNLIYHGLRRHCNLNSKRYRFFTERITEQLARHYAKYENIIMWQLDNEINCECDSYHSESDHEAFRAFLKERYGTIEAYNKEIGSVFWNQTYTSWEEVYLPRRTNSGKYGNPHVALLEKRFISETVLSFFKLQADRIRKYSKKPITTNGIFGHIDYHRLTEEVLDFITYDNYPNFAYERTIDPKTQNGLRDRNSSYNLSVIRSISPIYGIMEQQSGPGGWNFRMEQSAPKPGQMRLWTMQAIAHGADYISFFRWRTATFGTEIYWHGLHDYCNLPNRRTKELEQIRDDIQKIQQVCQKEYKAEVAILRDYDNMWDGEEDNWHSQVDRISQDGWFRALQKAHIPFDLIDIKDQTDRAELQKYKLIVYPHPTILTRKRAELLREYAERGGTIIFGCRTGYKKENGSCQTKQMPGYAADLVGAVVEDFTFVDPYEEEPFVKIQGETVPAPCFADILKITDGTEVGVFTTNYYAQQTACSMKRVKAGKAYYFGSAFAEDTAKRFLELEQIKSPLFGKFDLPASVEIAIRGEYIFFLNYENKEVEIGCQKGYTDLLTQTELKEKFILEPFGVAVLTQTEG